MTALLSMLVLGVACWLLRISFVTLLPAERLPASVRRALTHLVPAVLTAIVVVQLIGLTCAGRPSQALPLIAAVVVIGLVARRTRSLALACATGLGLIVVLDVVVPLV